MLNLTTLSSDSPTWPYRLDKKLREAPKVIRRSHFGDLARGAGTFGFRHGNRDLLPVVTVYRNGNREHCRYLCLWSDVGYADQDVDEWKPADYAMQFPGLVEDYRKVCGPSVGCEHCILPIGVTWFPETCSCGNLGNHMCV